MTTPAWERPDADWSGDTYRITRCLNGWFLEVLRGFGGEGYNVYAQRERVSTVQDVHGFSNALIIAEGLATDPEPLSAELADRIWEAVRTTPQVPA